MREGRRVKRGYGMLALLAALFYCQAAAAEWTLPQLMAALSHSDRGPVHFVEKKTLSYLDVPLTSSGVLSMDQDGVLNKETTSPKYELLRVDGNNLQITQGDRGEASSIPLDSHPLMRAFIEPFRAILLGDLPGIERFYLVEFSSDGRQWKMVLRPRKANLGAVISSVEIQGVDTRIREFTYQEQVGDVTVLTLKDE